MPSTKAYERLSALLCEMHHELACRDWNGTAERCENALQMHRKMWNAIEDYRDTYRLEMPLLTAFRRRDAS